MANREGYRFAVHWIAHNDDIASASEGAYSKYEVLDVLSGYVSIALVADMFHKDSKTVARDVLREATKE